MTTDTSTPTPETPAWDYAQFAAREFWLDLGREINDHTMAATAMINLATSMLTETLGYTDAPESPCEATP
ncbi:hypothetical protein [Sphingobium sp. KCTC 72723]|uniref:hypothetical protein n=1 Tax=Sphingobium sp. KCTC 72723 TaxID=2733867 RepID=UPI00165E6164|nr:hypothetical protein [Sphingobium sp. KCTC 72723]